MSAVAAAAIPVPKDERTKVPCAENVPLTWLGPGSPSKMVIFPVKSPVASVAVSEEVKLKCELDIANCPKRDTYLAWNLHHCVASDTRNRLAPAICKGLDLSCTDVVYSPLICCRGIALRLSRVREDAQKNPTPIIIDNASVVERYSPARFTIDQSPVVIDDTSYLVVDRIRK